MGERRGAGESKGQAAEGPGQARKEPEGDKVPSRLLAPSGGTRAVTGTDL